MQDRQKYVLDQIENFSEEFLKAHKDEKKFPLYSTFWIKEDLRKLWIK